MNLKSTSVSSIAYNIDLQLNQDKDSINQTYRLITTGYEAIDYRNKFSSSYKELKDKLLSNNPSSSDTIKSVDLNQIEKPFEIDFSKQTLIESIEDKIIISPFGSYVMTENPLKQPVRNYPIDIIYKNSHMFQSTIAIPNGYKLLTKPEDLRINNNLVKIIYVTNISDNNTIKVTGVYEFKNDVYGIPDYVELKNYFNKIVDKFNEKLVLIKV